MSNAEVGPVALGLGSNQGDRVALLLRAVEGLLAARVGLSAVSSVYETPPVGHRAQPHFLNMVVAGNTLLTPSELLGVCRLLEREAGRERPFPNAPRTLDIDVIVFSNFIVRETDLVVPHPRWKERSFVVRPLLEILPGFRDPETGWRVEEVARRWPAEPEEIHLVLGRDALPGKIDLKGAT